MYAYINTHVRTYIKYYNAHIPGLRVCHLSPIFWLVNKKLLIIEIESQSEKKI